MVREVFISYSQPDYDCAMELVARVESEGISCWIAPRDIAPSADWAAEIIDAISNSRVMILVFSASSNDSPQVRREVERAVHKQREHFAVSYRKRAAFEEPGILFEFAALDGRISVAVRGALHEAVRPSEEPIGKDRLEPQRRTGQRQHPAGARFVEAAAVGQR